MRRALVARLDSDGDVLLAGPAVRAVREGCDRLTLLVGPAGRAAAELLPGADTVIAWDCPWITHPAPPVQRHGIDRLVDELTAWELDSAVLLTSFHQSPLPLALLLRMAGVPHIAAASVDYPGSLLDVRVRPGTDIGEDIPEPRRALAVAEAAGYRLPAGDDGRLAVRPTPDVRRLTGAGRYLVLHPGARVPARRPSPGHSRQLVRRLVEDGHRVLVTGGPAERALTGQVAGEHGLDLGGRTDLAELAGVLAGADAVVVGNTGPAHLAAAVGTPVVSLFAPVVPAARWAPYGVPHVLLGDQQAACRDTRARECPVPGHPCLGRIAPADVLRAVSALTGSGVAA
ncbi:MAG: glycosyltransferase family 9 protein [Pseudonocardia sp.]